jgi:hypothetical protein
MGYGLPSKRLFVEGKSLQSHVRASIRFCRPMKRGSQAPVRVKCPTWPCLNQSAEPSSAASGGWRRASPELRSKNLAIRLAAVGRGHVTSATPAGEITLREECTDSVDILVQTAGIRARVGRGWVGAALVNVEAVRRFPRIGAGYYVAVVGPDAVQEPAVRVYP